MKWVGELKKTGCVGGAMEKLQECMGIRIIDLDIMVLIIKNIINEYEWIWDGYCIASLIEERIACEYSLIIVL